MCRAFVVVACASTIAGCGLGEREYARIAASPDAAPGEVRYGVRFSWPDVPRVAVLPDGGVAYIGVGGLILFDRTLASAREIGFAAHYDALVAAGPDAIYAAIYNERSELEVLAFDLAGVLRWRRTIERELLVVRDRYFKPWRIFARSEGPYLEVEDGYSTLIVAVDGADGAVRWSRQLGRLHAGGGGIFATRRNTSTTSAITRLDEAGTELWTRTVNSRDLGPGAATPSGGFVFSGYAASTVDFGDRAFPLPAPARSFVTELDPDGVPQWAFGLDAVPRDISLTPTREVVLAGAWPGDVDNEAFLAVADQSGIRRVHVIGGPGGQYARYVQVAPDGTAWLQARNEGDEPEPVLHIGSRAFTQQGELLFAIVP